MMVFEAVFFLEHDVTYNRIFRFSKAEQGIGHICWEVLCPSTVQVQYTVPLQTSDLDQKWTIKTKNVARSMDILVENRRRHSSGRSSLDSELCCGGPLGRQTHAALLIWMKTVHVVVIHKMMTQINWSQPVAGPKNLGVKAFAGHVTHRSIPFLKFMWHKNSRRIRQHV
jgi:hypothetical protein